MDGHRNLVVLRTVSLPCLGELLPRLNGCWRFCLVLLGVIWGVQLAAQELPPSVIKFEQAQVVFSTTELGVVPDARSSLPWQTVRLPDSWVKHVPARQGVGYYLFTFDTLPVWLSSERLSLFIPRAGNRFAIFLNGHFLGSTGNLTEIGEDHVNQPHQFLLPPGVLRPQTNELLVQVHGERARYAGLSEVWLGPHQVIEPVYYSRNAWQTGGALLIVGLSLFIGAMALSFGAVMRARGQFLFGLAALCWGVRTSYLLVTVPPLPHPWWGIGMDFLYGMGIVLLTFSILLTLRVKNKWSKTMLVAMASTTSVMPLAYGLTGVFAYRQYWLLSLVSGIALAVGMVLMRWWRVKNFESNVLSFSAIVALGLGLHDHWVVLYMPSGYGKFALGRFAFLFILLAMSTLLMRRVLRSINAAKRLRARIQNRLLRAGALISAFHDEREKKKVQEAETAERLRLLREMHDGVGAHLVTLRSMLRNPMATRADLENQLTQAGLALRDSLDTLHGDSLSWVDLLARLRDAVETRLVHAGIGLRWQVQPLGEWPLPSVDDQRHFRLLVTECVTHVIKRSGASLFTVQAVREWREQGSVWVVRLSDDGCGLNDINATGYGMMNILTHAKNIRAQCRVVALNPGTCIEIIFQAPQQVQSSRHE